MNLNERRKHVTAIESYIHLLTNHVVYTSHHAVHRVPTTGYCHVLIDSYVYIAKIARKTAWKRKKGEETVICAISIGNDDDKEMKFCAWTRPRASLPPRASIHRISRSKMPILIRQLEMCTREMKPIAEGVLLHDQMDREMRNYSIWFDHHNREFMANVR